jgi:hypothetical protein
MEPAACEVQADRGVGKRALFDSEFLVQDNWERRKKKKGDGRKADAGMAQRCRPDTDLAGWAGWAWGRIAREMRGFNLMRVSQRVGTTCNTSFYYVAYL